jgi:3-oxosteroid 1-dehydrogenase
MLIDADAHVLDETGSIIRGLYALGSCAATTTFGSGYNSGMALSRGLTLAYLVSQELGRPTTVQTSARRRSRWGR